MMPSSPVLLALCFMALVGSAHAIFKRGKMAKLEEEAKVKALEMEDAFLHSSLWSTAQAFVIGSYQIIPGVSWAKAKTLQILGRACFAANKLTTKETSEDTGFVYGWLTYVIGAFGGGIVCPLLLGSSPKPLENDIIVVCSLIAFVGFSFLGFGTVYQLPVIKQLGLVLENIFKGTLIVTFADAGAKQLKSRAGPIILGELITETTHVFAVVLRFVVKQPIPLTRSMLRHMCCLSQGLSLAAVGCLYPSRG